MNSKPSNQNSENSKTSKTSKNNLMTLASEVEKLKYEILHGCFDENSEIGALKLEIKEIKDIVINNNCNQLCLTELTDDEKENILKIILM